MNTLGVWGKLYRSMWTGSMMGCGPEAQSIMTYVIAHGEKGQVELNPKLLSALIGMPEEAAEKAIAFLCAPDPHSRNKDHDGARLIKTGTFTYTITGWEKYHPAANVEDRREYFRDAKRRQRERDNPTITDAEYQARSAEFPTPEQIIAQGKTIDCPEECSRKFHQWYTERKMWLAPNGLVIDWKSALVRWLAKERSPGKQGGSPTTTLRPADPYSIRKAIEIIQDQIADHPANKNGLSWGEIHPTEEQKKEFRELVIKRKQLEQSLLNSTLDRVEQHA